MAKINVWIQQQVHRKPSLWRSQSNIYDDNKDDRCNRVKANFKNKYRNIECEICKVEENTEHLFKCQKYLDLNEKIRGGTLQEILKINKEDDIAKIIKEIIKRKNNENKAENTRKKTTNTAPLTMGLSLPDGREWQTYI